MFDAMILFRYMNCLQRNWNYVKSCILILPMIPLHPRIIKLMRIPQSIYIFLLFYFFIFVKICMSNWLLICFIFLYRFKSEKTGRGPLVGADWKKKVDPVMTCYKLVTCEFKWFGLQSRIENFIQKSERRLFTNFHRWVYNSLKYNLFII